MRKNLDYLSTIKTADERNLEVRSELRDLKSLLDKAKTISDYLRNSFDDVLPRDQVKALFDLSTKLTQTQSLL